ncbi:hypothetical protein [Flavobacterium sp.]|jgi:hypothetical protein|uniref:hypothetical protein n=1 Tax=Flavobacterium sp. TaxID=239 RepID=UPI0037C1455B
MSALGEHYRWQVYNGTGVSVTCTVKDEPFKYGTDGALSFTAEATQINAVSVGTLAYSNSSTINNGTAKNLGAHVTFTAAPSASATGTVSLFLQRSTDGGTTWPSNGLGTQVAGITFSASSTSQTTVPVVR